MRPSNSPGPLLLFVQQHLQLFVGDETEIDENLANTSDGHKLPFKLILHLILHLIFHLIFHLISSSPSQIPED
jgi:hypothetical protein